MKATSLPTFIDSGLSSASDVLDFTPINRVIFGAGCLSKLGELTRELGGTKVLLVTDPGLEAAGHPQRASAILREAGLTVDVFDQVEENPTTKHVENGVIAAKVHRTDFLVAVGGGSAMDVAKGINFIVTNGGTMADYLGFDKATKPMLPSIGVPTTAGTGSEAQSYALIANASTHLKMACGDRKAAFRIALLDPELTVTQPQPVTAATGIDAIAHAMESHVCTNANAVSRPMSLQAFQLLTNHYLQVLATPDDIAARSAMQIGAYLAGSAIESAMLGCAHSCANPLTAHYGITHGIAVGLMLPHAVCFNSNAAIEGYAELGGTGEQLSERITSLLIEAQLPTKLSDLGISRSILPVLANEAFQQWTAKFNPRPVTEADLLHLYEAAY
jgi:alcohol dehydrogenase class IV